MALSLWVSLWIEERIINNTCVGGVNSLLRLSFRAWLRPCVPGKVVDKHTVIIFSLPSALARHPRRHHCGRPALVTRASCPFPSSFLLPRRSQRDELYCMCLLKIIQGAKLVPAGHPRDSIKDELHTKR